ncbi:hypothetical protein AH156_19940 [Salmonella enterica subsp. enterica serovar Enteritidis]|nr:hypothetical protein [Salmonella enterica subsp. enterica serovar Enteritidis]
MKKLIIALALASVSAAAFAAPAPAAPVQIDNGQYNCEQGGFFQINGSTVVFDGDDANAFHANKVQDMEGALQISSPKGGAQLYPQDKETVAVNFGHGAEDVCHKFKPQPKNVYHCADGSVVSYTFAADHSEAVGEYQGGNYMSFMLTNIQGTPARFKANVSDNGGTFAVMGVDRGAMVVRDGNGLNLQCKLFSSKVETN